MSRVTWSVGVLYTRASLLRINLQIKSRLTITQRWLKCSLALDYKSNSNVRCCTYRLNNADFPTLGRPMITTVGSLLIWIRVKSTKSSVGCLACGRPSVWLAAALTLKSSGTLSQASSPSEATLSNTSSSALSWPNRVQNFATFWKKKCFDTETGVPPPIFVDGNPKTEKVAPHYD